MRYVRDFWESKQACACVAHVIDTTEGWELGRSLMSFSFLFFSFLEDAFRSWHGLSLCAILIECD